MVCHKYSQHGYEIVGDEFEVRRSSLRFVDQRLNHDNITKSEILRLRKRVSRRYHSSRTEIKPIRTILKVNIDKSPSSIAFILCVVRRQFKVILC